MNFLCSSSDPNRNKARKWIAHHLGSFQQKDSNKDAIGNAFAELTIQLSDGRFRELQCTMEIDRDKRILTIKRWLDNVVLDEFNLNSISNVNSFAQVPQNPTLSNIVTFSTLSKSKASVLNETHIFHLEDLNTSNYLASDIRSAVESCTNLISNSNPIRVLPTMKQEASGKFSNFEYVQQQQDLISRTERSLLLLHYCFDDIDFFLQHLKDQEEARATLASNKNKISDRLLEGKARPSTQNAYVTCIQKTKFCFNLLGTLNGKIRDPDSYQLSILLMENVVKIGQAYNIYHNGKINKIKEPLLTDQTMKMLHCCLTKHYLKMWSSWGECWTKPREKWNGYEEKYYPELFNGFQIDIEDLIKDDIISPTVDQPIVAMNNAGMNQLIHSIQSLAPVSPNQSIAKGPTNQREEDFCRCVLLNGGRLYRVVYTFVASKDQEMSISEGEIIEVVELLTDKNWWLCANMQGQRGYCPCTVLENFAYIDKSLIPEDINVLQEAPVVKPKSFTHSLSLNNQSKLTTSPTNSLSFEKSLEEAKIIHGELQKKLNLPSSTFGASKKHGQMSINQDSTAEDVQGWLKFKKFLDDDIARLKDFSGQTLFLMSKDDMNRILDVDVAARLDSFLKVQKNMSGYATEGGNELDGILLKRKTQVDLEGCP